MSAGFTGSFGKTRKEFPSGEIDITGHPILGTNNYRDDHSPVPTEIGPTVFVSEPGTLALSALALLVLAGRRPTSGR